MKFHIGQKVRLDAARLLRYCYGYPCCDDIGKVGTIINITHSQLYVYFPTSKHSIGSLYRGMRFTWNGSTEYFLPIENEQLLFDFMYDN